MAKKWTPTQRQLSAYDELLRRQNEVRKHLLRRRRIAEEQGGLLGGLPDLVIPKKARRYRDLTRYRFDSFAEYRKARQRLSELFGGKTPLASFYKRNYQDHILELLKKWIVDKYGYTEKPADYKRSNSKEPTLYSDIQINEVSNSLARLLTLYNDVERLSAKEFMALYDLKAFPSLHIIYDDITGESNFGEVDRFIDEYSFNKKAVYKTDTYKSLVEIEKVVIRKVK